MSTKDIRSVVGSVVPVCKKAVKVGFPICVSVASAGAALVSGVVSRVMDMNGSTVYRLFMVAVVIAILAAVVVGIVVMLDALEGSNQSSSAGVTVHWASLYLIR